MSFIQFSEYRDRDPNLKRGRRLLCVTPGITSELGGGEPSAASAVTSSADNNNNNFYYSPAFRSGVRMFADQGQGIESTPQIKLTGTKRTEQKPFDDTDPTRSDRGDFVVAAWERHGKKKQSDAVRREDKPVGIKLCAASNRGEVDAAPFATSSDLNAIPFHRQRRYVEVPGSHSANSGVEIAAAAAAGGGGTSVPPPAYVPKRSRTPPASVKATCPNEGFTVVYSTNASEKARHIAGGMRMIPFGKHGKGTSNTDETIAQAREQAEAKREAAYLAHRQYLRQVAQRIVDGRQEHGHGKRLGAFHPVEREGGPNALDLPTPRGYVVGKSQSRMRASSSSTSPALLAGWK